MEVGLLQGGDWLQRVRWKAGQVPDIEGGTIITLDRWQNPLALLLRKTYPSQVTHLFPNETLTGLEASALSPSRMAAEATSSRRRDSCIRATKRRSWVMSWM